LHVTSAVFFSLLSLHPHDRCMHVSGISFLFFILFLVIYTPGTCICIFPGFFFFFLYSLVKAWEGFEDGNKALMTSLGLRCVFLSLCHLCYDFDTEQVSTV
jgi:hypothetical protein